MAASVLLPCNPRTHQALPPPSALPQVQFVGQCLMLAGGLALKALMQPGCATRLATHAALARPLSSGADLCLLDGVARWVQLARC